MDKCQCLSEEQRQTQLTYTGAREKQQLKVLPNFTFSFHLSAA